MCTFNIHSIWAFSSCLLVDACSLSHLISLKSNRNLTLHIQKQQRYFKVDNLFPIILFQSGTGSGKSQGVQSRLKYILFWKTFLMYHPSFFHRATWPPAIFPHFNSTFLPWNSNQYWKVSLPEQDKGPTFQGKGREKGWNLCVALFVVVFSLPVT